VRLLALPAGTVGRWVTIGLWLALVAGLSPFAVKLADITNDDVILPGGAQTSQVHRLLRERFPGGDIRPVLLVYRREGGLARADRRRILTDAREAAGVPLAARPIPPFGPTARPGQVSRARDIAFTVVPLTADEDFRFGPSIEALREVVHDGDDGLEVHVTGFPALLTDFNSAVKEADITLLIATGALVLLLLLAIYHSPILAVLPLFVVGVAYVVAAGIVYLVADGGGLTVSSTATSLLLVLMFGAGTDYCLLLVARFRYELRRDERESAGVARALSNAAPAMVASAVTVALALLVMLAGILGTIRGLGPVNAIGVVVVLLASLSLLPALLAALGRTSFWPATEAVSPKTRPYRVWAQPLLGIAPIARRDRWSALGERVRRRPAAWLVAGSVLLGGMALGAVVYESDVDVVGQFRADTDSTRGYETLSSGFPPGTLAPATVLVERRNGPVTRADLEKVRQRIAATPQVQAVVEGRRSRDGRIGEQLMLFADYPYSLAALDRVETIRQNVSGIDPNLSVLVGGGPATNVDYRSAASRDLKVVGPLVLLVVLLTLIVLLRALVAPLYLLATVIASLLATVGSSLLIFKLVFGRDTVDPVLPLIIFIFLVALGSDYNIFLMSKVREDALDRGTVNGMLSALVATGPVITSAGLILAGTFMVLAVLPVYVLLEIGIAVALGVLLDTFIVRSLLVPAITWLVGERSWWPSSAAHKPMIATRPAAARPSPGARR
jgi:putative drug exporter of the RND superfamily